MASMSLIVLSLISSIIPLTMSTIFASPCGGYGFLRLVRDALDLYLFRVDDVNDLLFLLRLLGALLVVAGVLVLRLHDIPNRSRGWS